MMGLIFGLRWSAWKLFYKSLVCFPKTTEERSDLRDARST